MIDVGDQRPADHAEQQTAKLSAQSLSSPPHTLTPWCRIDMQDKVSALALSRSGRYLASGQITYLGFTADIIVWDLEQRRLLHRLQLQKARMLRVLQEQRLSADCHAHSAPQDSAHAVAKPIITFLGHAGQNSGSQLLSRRAHAGISWWPGRQLTCEIASLHVADRTNFGLLIKSN